MSVHEIYDKLSKTVTQAFPSDPTFSAFQKPCRFEGEVYDVEVEGTIPPSIHGTFFRVMPDPQYPPYAPNDTWINGDGNISAFWIKDGRVQFKQRYVRTEKFVKERAAHRILTGKYRNKYTDIAPLEVRSTANTNIFPFNGMLLACKEDAHPYRMDPKTLETIGLYDFEGQLPSTTFTAHPKVDPESGELLAFGYEAKGDATTDVCYFTVNAQGKCQQTVWMNAPVVGMIHDFAFTKNWVIFPIIPTLCDLETLKAGGSHWTASTTCPMYMGVLPRNGAQGSEVKWFQYRNAYPGHPPNAYEDEDGNILIDMPLNEQNYFFFWPDVNGKSPDLQTLHADFVRFKIDPRSTDLTLGQPQILRDKNMEFPRIDERWAGKKYRHVFYNQMDLALGSNLNVIFPAMGGGFPPFNSVAHHDIETGKADVYFPGPTHLCQEPVFIPGSDVEGDGHVITLVNNYVSMSSELHIISTADFSKPVAVVKLPLRLRQALHGNWVDGQDLEMTFE